MIPCHPHHLQCPPCPPPLEAPRLFMSAHSWSTWGTLPWPELRPATCPSSPEPGPAPTDLSVEPRTASWQPDNIIFHIDFAKPNWCDVLSLVQIGECVLVNCVWCIRCHEFLRKPHQQFILSVCLLTSIHSVDFSLILMKARYFANFYINTTLSPKRFFSLKLFYPELWQKLWSFSKIVNFSK